MRSLFSILKAGRGRGNWGHVGIPGHRGGSAPNSLSTNFMLPEKYLDNQLNIKISELVKSTEESYKKLGVSKEGSFGWCAAVTVDVWDSLGKPKSLTPHSVMVGEDEHVVLSGKGLVIDVTGDQYSPDGSHISAGWKDNFGYTSFKKLTSSDIKNIRDNEIS